MRKGGQTCEASMIAGDSTVCFAEFERLYWWVAWYRSGGLLPVLSHTLRIYTASRGQQTLEPKV